MITVGQYLDRLELAAPAQADLRALASLHQRHLLKVPFENLDIRRGQAIELDEARFVEKIVGKRRGGFCYELNAAFAWLLRQLGYQVDYLSAEVIGDDERPSGRDGDHLCLRVVLPGEGAWLADVGFGNGPITPMDFASSLEIKHLAGTWRLVNGEGGTFELQRYSRERIGFVPDYRGSIESRELAWFSDACAFHQTSPESPFTQRTICTIAAPDGRVTLYDDRVVIFRNGRNEELPIHDDAGRQRALRRYFGINE
ncbi:MAG: arylamine N-acetyltransferase [Planctomycetes bacterium]|nr:arylamine N-acetyltransferase [Planctomycetota bacterium]